MASQMVWLKYRKRRWYSGRSTYLYKNVNKGSVKGYFDLDGISGAYLKGTKKKCKSTGKVSVIS